MTAEPLGDYLRREGRTWTWQVIQDGRVLWPMGWQGLSALTDQPAAAKDYTLAGARGVVTKLQRELPHLVDAISVVEHPACREGA